MTSEAVSPPRVSLRALLPGPVSRIGFGLLLVALVVRLTGDVSWGWGEPEELTAAIVAHLLLLPLLALTLWAAAPSSGRAGRPLPVVLTIVALGVAYLGDLNVSIRLFPGLWDWLLRSTELEGVVYVVVITGELLVLAMVVQALAFRGWLRAGWPRLVSDIVCWAIGAVAVFAVVVVAARLDLGVVYVPLEAWAVVGLVAPVLLAVVAWRAGWLAGVGALLYVGSAVVVALQAMNLGAPVVARISIAVYVVGQALLAAGVLRRLSIRFDELS